MANVLINESSMTAIANAIRTKKGVSTTYKPSEMADAISSISTGGITPTGTKSITANGTYDVTNFASAEVNVPTSGTTPTGTKEISITANGTTTEDVSAYANAQITVNVPTGGGGDSSLIDSILDGTISGTYENDTVTRLKFAMFRGCDNLQHVKFPSVTNIDNSSFYTCSNLESISAVNCTSTGGEAFRSCPKLKTLTTPKLNDIIAGVARDCPLLETVDMKGGIIRTSAFANCTSLDTVILRNTAVGNLVTTDAFNGTPFASGGTGGTFYVPSALISSYQSATNWSTILGYTNNQILPIEGSIYETQYADGTPISA